jgi:hypothetical protein
MLMKLTPNFPSKKSKGKNIFSNLTRFPLINITGNKTTRGICIGIAVVAVLLVIVVVAVSVKVSESRPSGLSDPETESQFQIEGSYILNDIDGL